MKKTTENIEPWEFIKKIQENYTYYSDSELETIIQKIPDAKERNRFYLQILHAYYQWNDDFVILFKEMGERVNDLLNRINTSHLTEYQLYWYCFFQINRMLRLDEDNEKMMQVYESYKDKFNKYKLLMELERASILINREETLNKGLNLLKKLQAEIENTDLSYFRKGFYLYRLAQKADCNRVNDDELISSYYQKARQYLEKMSSSMCSDILIKINIFFADENYFNNNEKKALEQYKSLLSRYPFLKHHYYILQQIGGAYLSMEKYDEALIYLEKSYAVYPEKEFFHKFYLVLNLAASVANRNDFSREDVNKAIEILEKNIHRDCCKFCVNGKIHPFNLNLSSNFMDNWFKIFGHPWQGFIHFFSMS